MGLDLIQKFKLCQDENLNITQKGTVMKNEVKIENNNTTSIQDIIRKNNDIFAKSKFDIGEIKGYEASIKFTEYKYISTKPLGCSFQDKEEIEKQVSKLLKAKLIEESCSPYTAPVTMVFKKEEGRRSRSCIDFKELNKIIVPESQPFPRVNDLTLRAGNCKFFTKLDVNSTFWSILVHQKGQTQISICNTSWSLAVGPPPIWFEVCYSNFSKNSV